MMLLRRHPSNTATNTMRPLIRNSKQQQHAKHQQRKRLWIGCLCLTGIALSVWKAPTLFVFSTIPPPDAIVVGSGLAGLTAALSILDRGGRVLILEKTSAFGGNSNKASSGVNAVTLSSNDSVNLFIQDTTKSAGRLARPDLIQVLVTQSGDTLRWLSKRLNLNLTVIAQLGGHQVARTHRPPSGMVGSALIAALVAEMEQFVSVQIITEARVVRLLEHRGSVIGVEYQHDGQTFVKHAANVILATGGFASDLNTIQRYRPDYQDFPTTAGSFSTGDALSFTQDLNVQTIDMKHIQLHPTGFVDPQHPDERTKTLAAEVLRGNGGILLNGKGRRFCNELDLRSTISQKMLEQDTKTFYLMLSSDAAQATQRHVDWYRSKGLMRQVSLREFSDELKVTLSSLEETLREYQQNAKRQRDSFGKKDFRNVPKLDDMLWVGQVTPVSHYCMGGLAIDTEARAINQAGHLIPGLYACGEVAGGVHGMNRLGGNSLLECTVFGRRVGNGISIHHPLSLSASKAKETTTKSGTRTISLEELNDHNTEDDCWVVLNKIVYDLSDFMEKHPAGKGPIRMNCAKDASEIFNSLHDKTVLKQFQDERVGKIA